MMNKIFAVLLSSLWGATSAWSCSCLIVAPETLFASSPTAFIGNVTSIQQQDPGNPLSSLNVQFFVAQSLKGPLPGTVTIQTAGNSAACGYTFIVGRDYAVLANGAPPSTGICSGTVGVQAAPNVVAKYQALAQALATPVVSALSNLALAVLGMLTLVFGARAVK